MPPGRPSGGGRSSLHPFLGVALAAALAQFASGEEAPYVAPESLLPLGFGAEFCDDLWRAVTGDCNSCVTVSRWFGYVWGGPTLYCAA